MHRVIGPVPPSQLRLPTAAPRDDPTGPRFFQEQGTTRLNLHHTCIVSVPVNGDDPRVLCQADCMQSKGQRRRAKR